MSETFTKLKEETILNIILGYWLDSAAYPDALDGKEAAAGTVVTGFNGMIGLLETQLGLTFPLVSDNLRIAEWQELIRSVDTGSMPFSKSIETDSWNTARELLRRRDELVLAGWDPVIHRGGSSWLQTLAQLELANSNRTWGFPDRVRSLLANLEEQPQLHIDNITIVDEAESLWDPWAIELLQLLKAQGIEIQKNPALSKTETQQNPSSDLSLLQRVLSGEKISQEVQGDSSLLLIRSEQEWDAADFLISWLQENGTEDTVLIKGEGSLILDELLHRRGIPGNGVETASKWRSVLQVLPLTIDTFWKPIRADRMLELLTIPASPVPGRIRYRLANALAQEPGIGGPSWMNAIEAGLQNYEEFWAKEGLEEQDMKKRRKDLEARLDLWIRHDYYDPNEGIPYETFVHLCSRVSQWASAHYHRTNDPIYAQAAQVAGEVMEGIKTLGVSDVTHLQAARILDSVLGEGAELSDYEQEAAKWEVVRHPGQIWGSAETILWWGFHKDMTGPSTRTWTASERAWLRDQGIHLPEENRNRLREAASWQQAVRFAKGRLILFAPAKVKGTERPLHPLWDEIRYAAAKDNSTLTKIMIDASELRKQPSHPLIGEKERIALSPKSLPEPIRTWQIPQGTVQPRQEESATSFEALLGCPVKWTFSYAANVRPGNILSLPNDSLMLGNLGHVILEKLISEKPDWNEEEVKIRAGELFDEWSPRIAATLLEPKNSILRNETRYHLQRSLQKFFKVLKHAGIKIQHTELELQKPWKEDVNFKGRLDLVGETAAGRKMLLDAKWSKRPSNYKQRLENLSVQLTLYHWLLADHEAEELPVAYFMLRSGHFFSSPHDEFPSEYHVEGPSLLEAHKVVQQAVEDVWRQLSNGTAIAPGVPLKADGQEEEAFVPSIDPPCAFCVYQNLCGVRREKQ